MSTNISTLYPGRVNAPDASYPTGSIKNETTPGISNDGTPLDQDWGNDFEGTKQALIRAAGISINGNSDTAELSQILQGILQQAAGRAYNYDDTGSVNAYVTALRASQQGLGGLFDGLIVQFPASFDNTGASTVDVSSLMGNVTGTDVFDIKLLGGAGDPVAGAISASGDTRLVYRDSPSPHFELQQITGTIGVGQAWQDVAGSRSASTNYTNSTGRPIQVNIYRTGTTTSGSLIVDGVTVATVNPEPDSGATCTAIVPNGGVYSFSASFNLWAELR